MQSLFTEYREIRHAHFFAGLGGGAKGFNQGHARVGNTEARFRCIGGIDNNAAAVRDFKCLTGVDGTLLDLFDREQYKAFYGSEPPADWREATVEDVRKAFHYETPHIIFLSPPCKGFSGLLSERLSKTEKYQALNRLVTRGLFLALEAYQDDLPELILVENVPRVTIRGRWLLDQITALMNHYGYAVAETTHDCGEIGGLAQSRKRFLLVARNVVKVPPFLYEPEKKPLRSVGEVLSRAPLPGDPRGGPMHRLPLLTWKTWVRLAFVEAGGDWRSLNKLNIVDGKLADYVLLREARRNDFFGVVGWNQPAGTITGDARPSKGRFAVTDPRPSYTREGNLGVAEWNSSIGTIRGESLPSNGAFCVADPRTGYSDNQHTSVFSIAAWEDSVRTITGSDHVTGGALSVADPRGIYSGDTHKNVYRLLRWDEPSQTIGSGHGPSSGGMSVADPRFDHAQGLFSGKYAVQHWDAPSATVIGSDRVGSGALCVADPRPAAQKRPGDSYLTNGNYGVVGWEQPAGAISASACHDNGRWSVADPRGIDGITPGPASDGDFALPEPSEKCNVIIIARDGTFHRPFTTAELAILQSLMDPEDIFDLDGTSDAAKRERIGNAVPSDAAATIASTMGKTLLMAWTGTTFALSSLPIWVQPVAAALAVKPQFDPHE